MMQDLTAVRELCMKLDQTRESLSRQLTAKSLDHDQVRLRFARSIIHVQYCDIMRFTVLHNRHHKVSRSSCIAKPLLS